MTVRSASGTATVEATTSGVRAVGPWLRGLLADMDTDEATRVLGKLELAVHEVCMNCVDHADLPAGSTIELCGGWDDHAVQVTVTDTGLPFDSDGVVEPVPGVAQIRGYGLLLIRRLVDDFDYRRANGVNVWTLGVRRTPTPDQAPAPAPTAGAAGTTSASGTTRAPGTTSASGTTTTSRTPTASTAGGTNE